MLKLARILVVAALVAVPAFAADSVTGVIAAIDTENRVITLEDKTEMIVGKDVDLSSVKVGDKVTIATKLDEDGHAAATAITPAQ